MTRRTRETFLQAAQGHQQARIFARSCQPLSHFHGEEEGSNIDRSSERGNKNSSTNKRYHSFSADFHMSNDFSTSFEAISPSWREITAAVGRIRELRALPALPAPSTSNADETKQLAFLKVFVLQIAANLQQEAPDIVRSSSSSPAASFFFELFFILLTFFLALLIFFLSRSQLSSTFFWRSPSRAM